MLWTPIKSLPQNSCILSALGTDMSPQTQNMPLVSIEKIPLIFQYFLSNALSPYFNNTFKPDKNLTNILQCKIYKISHMILLYCHQSCYVSSKSWKKYKIVFPLEFKSNRIKLETIEAKWKLTFGYPQTAQVFLIFSFVRLCAFHFKILQAMDHLSLLWGDYSTI